MEAERQGEVSAVNGELKAYRAFEFLRRIKENDCPEVDAR